MSYLEKIREQNKQMKTVLGNLGIKKITDEYVLVTKDDIEVLLNVGYNLHRDDSLKCKSEMKPCAEWEFYRIMIKNKIANK